MTMSVKNEFLELPIYKILYLKQTGITTDYKSFII